MLNGKGAVVLAAACALGADAGCKRDTTVGAPDSFLLVAPVPLRCVKTEAAIAGGGDPLATLAAEISPIDDIRSVATYRRRVAQFKKRYNL